jgi:hypothetical protein
MDTERIKVKVTESGQEIEVVVLNKRAGAIEVVIGEGVHSVRCMLTPTRSGAAYAGSIRGRELVYGRSVADVEADLARRQMGMNAPRRR